jgi:hypothetical protein
MHNIHDIKSIYSQNVFISNSSAKLSIQNISFQIINQHKIDMCHV